MYSNDEPWMDHAHSVEPSVSLLESAQSFFEDFTDQELRGGDAPVCVFRIIRRSIG